MLDNYLYFDLLNYLLIENLLLAYVQFLNYIYFHFVYYKEFLDYFLIGFLFSDYFFYQNFLVYSLWYLKQKILLD